MQTKLNLVSEIAKEDKKCKFNNLVHLLNSVNLIECFYMLNKGKAMGVDKITWEEYEEDLETNIAGLVERMRNQAYKPQAVRRVYIPKGNGKLRPLGIPAIEDKIVQMGIKRVLEAVYEKDFMEFSYGFRPNRNCHDALKRLNDVIIKEKVSYIIDADIKGYFDNVNHEWMQRMLEERISDKSLVRIIIRFLKAGIMEQNEFKETGIGTPQGGIISPVLANIYLHYVLDLWVEKAVKVKCKGYVEIVRYADDFIICAQYKYEANLILERLKQRLKKFGLETAEDKTRLIEFGRFAKERVIKVGKKKPESFNFLGFTHYCSVTRNGKFKISRTTEKKKMQNKLKEIKGWLKTIYMRNIREWWKIFCSKIRGHYQYYGVSENYKSINKFYRVVRRYLYKILNRRSQKKSFTWGKLTKYLEKYNFPRPKIYHLFLYY